MNIQITKGLNLNLVKIKFTSKFIGYWEYKTTTHIQMWGTI